MPRSGVHLIRERRQNPQRSLDLVPEMQGSWLRSKWSPNSTCMTKKWALRSRLKKQPIDRQTTCYFGDGIPALLRYLLLSSGFCKTYAVLLLKTESQSIAELQTDEYNSLKQLHSCAREFFYSGTWTADPGEDPRRASLFCDYGRPLDLFSRLARPHCSLHRCGSLEGPVGPAVFPLC